MSRILKSLALLLLLLMAQQGAVVHDLSHLARADSPGLNIEAGINDASCALCPAFAQAGTPAFSHSFHLPSLLRASPDITAAPLHAAIDSAVPRPRSRGPPV
jgi:hypothetical protein